MYSIARNSTVRMIIDTVVAPGDDQIAYIEWDGHAEKAELPRKDLVGLVGFSCTQNDEFHDITFGIAIMTGDDPDLSRSTAYVDRLYTRLAALKRFTIFDMEGVDTGFEAVIFDGTSVSPMGRVDFRPTVEIEVTARLTRAGLPDPT